MVKLFWLAALTVIIYSATITPGFAEGPIARKLREKAEERKRKKMPPPEDPAWSQSEACRVKNLDKLNLHGGGFAWSPTDDNIVFFTHKDDKGVVQVYRANLKSQQEECLTCKDIAGGPLASQNKGAVSFHPDGQHLVMMVEMADYPLKKVMGNPGAGWFFNVWMTNLNFDRWWPLTDYPHQPPHGVLLPQISPDGKRLAWAQLYDGPPGNLSKLWRQEKSNKGPIYGRWQLNVADLIKDTTGFKLERIVSSKTSDHDFYETQGWSPDGSKLLYTADTGRDTPYKIDIWMRDLVAQKSFNLTDTDNAWEEFARFSPDGKKIVYMSSLCCPTFNPDSPKHYLKSLMTEVYLMDADGGRKVRLTHFNVPGFSEYYPGRNIAGAVAWNPSGDKILVEHTNASADSRRWKQSLWLINLAGQCGQSQDNVENE